MTAPQHGVWMGLLYTAPVVVWAFAQGALEWQHLAGVHMAMHTAVKVLWFTQIIALSLLVSGVLVSYPLRDQATGALAALWLPLPILPLAWLAGAVSGAALVHGQLLVWGVCLLLLLAVNGVRHLPITGRLRALSTVGAQLLGVAVMWRYREVWWGWIGV